MKKTLAVIVLVFFVLLSGCEKKVPRVNSPAPDFILKDIEGKSVRLSDYRGKVVVLEFWATWCPPCKLAIPEFNSLYEKYIGREFEVLAVSIDEDSSGLRSFAKEYGISYPVLADNKNVAELYGITNIPTTIIINKEGIISNKHLGYVPGMAELLSEDIEALL